MTDRQELKRQIVQAIYEAWDYYPEKKKMMGSPEATRIAETIMVRFEVRPGGLSGIVSGIEG